MSNLNNKSADGVKSLKELRRWIKLLENSSGSVINNLKDFADRRDIALNSIIHGKEILDYIIESLEDKSK